MVLCSDCGGLYEASPRTLREMRQQERLPRCAQCRRPFEHMVTNVEKLFWLERFTMAQMVEMAEAIWGDRHRWPEWRDNARRGLLLQWDPDEQRLAWPQTG